MGAVLGTVSSRTRRGLGPVVVAGSVAAADRSPARQAGAVGASVGAADRRGTAPSSAPGTAVAQQGRRRGDQPWRGRWGAVPADRSPAGASPVNGVAGAGPQRRSPPLPGPGRRRRGVLLGPAAKAAKLVAQPRRRAVVEAKLALCWSPEQIAGWLPLAYPQDLVMGVWHETIYLSLFVQSRGALRRERQRYLRTGRAMRHRRGKRLPQAAASSATSSPSASGPRRPLTGPCLGIGRRPGVRQAAQRGRDLGRAPQPLCGVGSPARGTSRPAGAAGADHRRAGAAPAAAPLTDLGSGSGDGRPWAVHRRRRRPGLFLRPAESLAGQHQRAHQRPALPIPPQGGDLRQLDQAALDAIAAELNGRPRQPLGFKTASQAPAEALPRPLRPPSIPDSSSETRARPVEGPIVTSSVPANGGEALCGSPFPQVAANRTCRSCGSLGARLLACYLRCSRSGRGGAGAGLGRDCASLRRLTPAARRVVARPG
jgi:transposase, IS30 family